MGKENMFDQYVRSTLYGLYVIAAGLDTQCLTSSHSNVQNF